MEQHIRPQGEQASRDGSKGKGDEGHPDEVRGYEPGDGKEHGGDDGRRLHQKAGRNDESESREYERKHRPHIDTTSTGTRAGFAVQAAAADDASVQVLLNGR